ncbi:molybdopterin-guanine dinucleotide biosynthesis protein B [Candidatus Bathyarchaeota archaeon]|nr:molybdopterin-guanine dinucleotide biosynthesis protein B [Candidatus Bathyarchaeota archaeon]
MKKMAVVSIVGGKSSGKTATVEALTKELTKRGYRVAAAKHIPEPHFTIDTVDKDTWRFAKSGAKTIISVAANEIVTIEKVNTQNFSLKEILRKCKNNDIVFLEGFRKLVSKNKKIQKIVAVKSKEEAVEALKNFKPLLAFTGPYSTEEMNIRIPHVDVFKNPEKIANIVEKTALRF